MPQINEAICAIALTKLPDLTRREAVQLCLNLGSAVRTWQAEKGLLEAYEITPEKLSNGRNSAIDFAQQEWEYCQNKNIRILPLTDADYPNRLRNISNPPLVLYTLGHGTLNAPHTMAVVGTRRCSDYGQTVVESLIRDASVMQSDTIIVSGLAYGIDILAHRAALNHQLPTIAVLAHGLDRIYPTMHRDTALQILNDGLLITEYPHGTPPESYNFLQRNRIIAGISDTTLVVESAYRGGALATARLAFDANRPVFACPGRVDDVKSEGCNELIRQQIAQIYTGFDAMMKAIDWTSELDMEKLIEKSVSTKNKKGTEDSKKKLLIKTYKKAIAPQIDAIIAQRNPQQQKILRVLQTEGKMGLDVLSAKVGLSLQQLTDDLFELEMEGIVKALPGATYRLSLL